MVVAALYDTWMAAGVAMQVVATACPRFGRLLNMSPRLSSADVHYRDSFVYRQRVLCTARSDSSAFLASLAPQLAAHSADFHRFCSMVGTWSCGWDEDP